MKPTLAITATLLLTGCYTQLQVVEPYQPPVRKIVYEREVVRDVVEDEDVAITEEESADYEEEVIYLRDRDRALFQDRDYERGFADGYSEGYEDARYDFRRHRWYSSSYDPFFYEPRWVVYYSHRHGWDWGWGWGHPYYSYYGFYGYYPAYYHPYHGYGHNWITYNYYYVNPDAETPVARNVNRGRRDSGYQGSTGSSNTGRASSGTGVRRSSGETGTSRSTGTRTTGTQVRRETGSGSNRGTRTTSSGTGVRRTSGSGTSGGTRTSGSSGTTTRPRRDSDTPQSSARPAEQPRRTTEARPQRETTRSEAPKRSSGSTSSSSSTERPKRRN